MAHAAEVDYAAAMNEAMSNLEVRRLMLVLTNVLTPACVMAVTDCLAGSNVAASFAWLPRLVLPICGGLLLATGFFVAGVLARCHFGLVVNGTKLQMVETGKLALSPLNWLGVTTNFLIITAMSTALGALALCAGLGLGASSWIAAGVVLVAVLAWLPSSHARANRACQEFSLHWQTAEIPIALREEHTRKSLDATSSDISVVVVMAAALFAGLFNALTNLGGIRPNAETTPPVSTIQNAAPVVLLGFAFVSLLFSCRILVRLRIAFGEHSQRLAALRDETDTNAMRWRAQERTYLLYSIVLVLLAATGIMLGYDRSGPVAGMTTGGLALVAGLVWYPATLRAARHRST